MIDLRGLIFGVVLVLGVSLMIEGATDPNRSFFVLGCFLVGMFAVEAMER